MYLYKLDAIPSTNSYLKDLVKNEVLESFTVVSAEFQTKGRGQMETVWYSSEGSNLLFSILIKFQGVLAADQFYLNCAVSLAILEALKAYELPDLRVKWPNDIMADNRKLAGMLIENSILSGQIRYTIVGIGLNVNEEKFPDELPKAVSMYQILSKKIDRDILLQELVEKIKLYAGLFEAGRHKRLMQEYKGNLYKFGRPAMYKTTAGEIFMGKIIDIDPSGSLVLEFQDETQRCFRFKEIMFL